MGVGSDRDKVPGQQFGDAVDGMVGDAFEDLAEIALGVEAVELGGAGQGIDRGGAFATIDFLPLRGLRQPARH